MRSLQYGRAVEPHPYEENAPLVWGCKRCNRKRSNPVHHPYFVRAYQTKLALETRNARLEADALARRTQPHGR